MEVQMRPWVWGCLTVLSALVFAGCSGERDVEKLRSAETVFFVRRNPVDHWGRFVVFRTDNPHAITLIADEVAGGMARRTQQPDIVGISLGYLLLGQQDGTVTYRLAIGGHGVYREPGYEYDMRAVLQITGGLIEDGALKRVRSWELDRLPDLDELEPCFSELFVDPLEETR